MEDDKPLILPEPRSQPMTRSFLPEKDSNQAPTPKLKACKLWNKAPATPPNDKETHAMTGTNKPGFYYMNIIASSHRYMHKVLNVLQSWDLLSLCKSQEP